jgi:hypothetical protein
MTEQTDKPGPGYEDNAGPTEFPAMFRERLSVAAWPPGALQKALLPSMKPALDAMASIIRPIATNTIRAVALPRIDLGSLLPPEMPELITRLRAAIPENWRELENAGGFDWLAAADVMNDGIPLIWVPGPLIVGQLLDAADSAARENVLLAERSQIVSDCDTALSHVTTPDLLPLADLAAASAAALSARHDAASQALSANVLDTWLHDATRRQVAFTGSPKWRSYEILKKQIQPVGPHTAIMRVKTSGALTPILPALARFDPATDPIPTRFARHATTHAAGTSQYTTLNALIALMLTTSVLRQSQESGW